MQGTSEPPTTEKVTMPYVLAIVAGVIVGFLLPVAPFILR